MIEEVMHITKNPYATLLYLWLYDLSDSAQRTIHITQDTLANKLHVSKYTIGKAFQLLTSYGLVKQMRFSSRKPDETEVIDVCNRRWV